MWPDIKSRLPFTQSKRSQQIQKAAPLGVSVRIYWNNVTYSISAYTYSGDCDAAPELYLKTRSKAIAHYCLFGYDDDRSLKEDTLPMDRSNGRFLSPQDPASQSHALLCLRLRRCCAIEFPAKRWQYAFYQQEVSDQRLMEYVQQEWKYVFGWPKPVINEGVLDYRQPTWICRVPEQPRQWSSFGGPEPEENNNEVQDEDQSAYVDLHGKIAPQDGIEAIMRFYDLGDCQTMEDYCEKLEGRSAVYYADGAACAEAKELGLVGPVA